MIPTALLIGLVGGFWRRRAMVVVAVGLLWAILLAADGTRKTSVVPAWAIIASAHAAVASLVGATRAHLRMGRTDKR